MVHEWEIVTTVKGAGNSSQVLTYTSNDETPYPGISYYRLKQTDFDGQFTFSDLRVVNLELEDEQIIVYPNPTNDRITVKGTQTGIGEISLYSLLGQDVSSAVEITGNWKTHYAIDLSVLPAGVYILKTKTSSKRVIKQ